MITLTQSVRSTNYVQVLITALSPSGGLYNPTADTVQFAFPELTYPPTSPSAWYTGSWATYPGPAYWAQCLVGPAGSVVTLSIGQYAGWLKITDDPSVPVMQPFILVITP